MAFVFLLQPGRHSRHGDVFNWKKFAPNDAIYSKYRRKLLGHNFDTNPGGIEYRMARLIPIAVEIMKGTYGDRCEWPRILEPMGYNIKEIQALLKLIERAE